MDNKNQVQLGELIEYKPVSYREKDLEQAIIDDALINEAESNGEVEPNESFIGPFEVNKMGSERFFSNITPGEGYGWAIRAKKSKNQTIDREYYYELEVDNIRVRNKLAVHELVFQQTRAVNGTLVVSSTGKIKFGKRKKDNDPDNLDDVLVEDNKFI